MLSHFAFYMIRHAPLTPTPRATLKSFITKQHPPTYVQNAPEVPAHAPIPKTMTKDD